MCSQLTELAKEDHDSLASAWGKYLQLACKKIPEDIFRSFQRESFEQVNRYLPQDTAPPPPPTFLPPHPPQSHQQPTVFDLGFLAPTGTTPPVVQQFFRRTQTGTATATNGDGPSGVSVVSSKNKIYHTKYISRVKFNKYMH